MKQGFFEIIENVALTKDIFRMKLKGDTSAVTTPGQFINIKIGGFYLRRPISVCDCENDIITIIYKVVGHGTEVMAQMKEGSLDALTGLGNGYDTALSGEHPVVLAFRPFICFAKN